MACVLAVPAHAAPAEDTSKAREHYQKGLVHFDLKEYSEALAQFKNAYRVVSDPVFLFNIAQCHRLLGQLEEALDFYRNYLRRAPQAQNRAEVDRRVEELERELSARPKSVVAKPAGSEPTKPAPPSVAQVPPPPPLPPPSSPIVATAPPPPLPPPAATGAGPRASVDLGAPAASPADVGASPAFYTRWWFWTGVGVALAGAAVAVVALRPRGEIGDCGGLTPCWTVGK